MKDLGNEIREIVINNKQIKNLIGGIPYSSEINKAIQNSYKFFPKQKIQRQRTRIGFYEKNNANKIIGYHSITILKNSNPTQYEKEFIELSEKLNYLQAKLIIVDPKYWGENVSKNLLKKGINLSEKLNLCWVGDVKKSNTRVIKFLEKYKIVPNFEWKTPNDTQMYRMNLLE